ncbi:MAG: PEP-CTERM sorting domain-containing protein [Akkermansia sp.]|nr:PEP-CTERM sorting domain-containing protein [Akkermansia sp.]
MKLSLPIVLRRAVIAALFFISASTTVYAGCMHEDAYLTTYTDFGQNRGRYVVGTRVNALLEHLREKDGGIAIEYKDGTPTYIISNEQGMIDFRGAPDAGYAALIGNNFLATVKHNGSLNGSYSGNDIGTEHAISYSAVDIRGSEIFRLFPESLDYMVQRQSKLATDAVSTPVISLSNMTTLTGQLMYHVGSGSQGVYTEHNKTYNSYCGAYVYNIGDIVEIKNYGGNTQTGDYTVGRDPGFGDGIGASEANPLPSALRAGDSGSPMFFYNQEKGRYEFLAVEQSGNPYSADYGRGNKQWTNTQLTRFDRSVSMGADCSVVHLGAIDAEGETLTDNLGNSTTLYSGKVTNASRQELTSYKGIRAGEHTWRDLSEVKNTANWYAYDSNNYDANSNSDGYLLQSRADLFFTENLVFSSSGQDNTIVLDATVDLGAGYAEFKNASYTIQAATGNDFQFNHAGYVIHEGAEVHLKLTNPDNYMREWRKTGAGDLYIDGTGNTNALLNLGGTGTTYLKQQNGHAAYNVLLNMGASLVIDSTMQVARDVTFGSGGGTLDMNGNSMDWYTTGGENLNNAFTINALTEEAMLTNSSTSDVTLTYKQGGETTYLGSFRDSTNGALIIDYKGGGTWHLNGIHTDLSQHENSGLNVTNGTVILSGVNTIHGEGSATGRNQDRLVAENDWHYADATMNVNVEDGGTFELGSHARLSGDVEVQSGGTFVMHEGVQHAEEYIEGGTSLQSTADIQDFYGLKGNVQLNNGSAMRIEFSEGTKTANSYDGKISGTGSLTVELGAADKKLILSGDNSGLSGEKELASGYLVAENLHSLGNTDSNTWKMTGVDAVLASHEGTAADLLARVHGDSVGTLALSGDTESALDLSGYTGLYIGAEDGTSVHYGRFDTALDAVGGKWQLGGGGGELYVDFKLSGNNNLVLGISETASGTVVLNNGENDFTGGISFSGKGLILKSVTGGLGAAKLDLNYGNALGASSTDVLQNHNLVDGSNGILLVNDISGASINLTDYADLALGAQGSAIYNGDITLAEGAAYRFSAAAGGSLTVSTALEANRDIVVDGQGLSGGSVVLKGNATLNGAIAVRGNATANSHGDITFVLGRNLTTTGAVTVENGGTIDLAGYNLAIAGSLSGTGGRLIDSKGYGVLTFTADSTDVSSDAYMDLGTVRKTGAGNFSLTNENVVIDHLYVDNGSVSMGAGARGMTVHLANGTHVDVGTHTMQFDLNMAFNSGVAELKHTGNNNVTLAGDINLGGGSQLNLHGGSGVSYTLNGANYGGGNAVLSVDADRIQFNTQSTAILGTLKAESDLEIYSNASGELERSISELHISNGAKVTLNERTWKTIWNIDSLSGEGELNWKSNTTHYNTSRVVLKGDGGFTGTISLERNRNNAERTHGAFIELASDTAAKNAVISLSGANSNSIATLAVNTHNASIKGLKGNEHSYVYAGESMDAAALSGTARPTATRNATLIVNVADGEEYTYAGALGCDKDTTNAGLNFVKIGNGVQNLTGSIATNNLTVKQGTLNISQAPIRGNLEVGLGANLNTGGSLVLNSGQMLSAIMGVEGDYSSAVLNGSLTLNGGSLGFDAAAIAAANKAGNAALSLQGINLNGAASINFTNYTAFKTGQVYTLATGNWQGLAESLTSTGLGYYSAAFSTNDSGYLQMTLTNGGSAILWKGTDADNVWDRNSFGPDNNSTNNASVVVFEDGAECKTVSMTVPRVYVKEVIFNNTEDYTIARGAEGYMVGATAQSLSVVNTGTVVVNDCITVTGNTVVNNGTLVYKMSGLLEGEVSGTGTFEVAWGSATPWGMYEEAYNLKVNGLNTLHISNGILGYTESKAMNVENIILESAGTYIQGNDVDQTSNFVVNGGRMQLGNGSLNGTLTQNGNAELQVRNGANAYLNSTLTQNGKLLTQTGGGALHIGADSATVLQNYRINSGSLLYDSGAMSQGNGHIEVAGGKLHVQSGAGLEAEEITITGGALQVDAGASLMGASALHLAHASAVAQLDSFNTYNGGTTIDAGVLTATANGALGSGAIELNGGSLVVGAAARNIFSTISGMTMTGGLLDLSAISFNEHDAMALNGAYSITGGSINLGSSISQTDTSYAIFDITNAELDWENLKDRVMVNGVHLNCYKDVSMSIYEGAATLTFGSFELSKIVVPSNSTLSYSESQLLSMNTPIVVSSGATLVLTGKETSANLTSEAFDNVSGEGNVELTLSNDNGVGFNLSGISGDVIVATGRLQVNTSQLNDESTIKLNSASSQLVFNGNGTELNNDVELATSTTVHVNSGKDGTILGTVSGNGGLTKAGGGTLTFAAENTYIGETNISGGKIVLDVKDGGNYTLRGAMKNGTLEVSKDTTLVNNGMEITSTLKLLAGASADMTGSCKLKGDIHVGKGAELVFSGNNAYDTIDYGTPNKKIVVDGGIVDFGKTRQTIQGWSISLKNGAVLKGSGQMYNGTTYAAAMDFNQDATIRVESGENTIAANMRLRGGNTRTLTYDIADGATLNLAGRMHADDTNAKGNVIKSGTGTLDATSQLMLNKLVLQNGETVLSYTGQDGNTISTIQMGSDATLKIAQDAKLLLGNAQVSISGDGESATLKTTAAGDYSVSSDSYELSNGHIQATGENTTIGNKLVNSTVENAGTGTLLVTHDNNVLKGIKASSGSISIHNSLASFDLQELTIGTQQTVTILTSDVEVGFLPTYESTVNVTSSAHFATGATLNANLKLDAGTMVRLDGALAMGSSLTLVGGETAITLTGDMYEIANALEYGESLVLFSGVDNFSLETSDTSLTFAPGELTADAGIKANHYFSNLEESLVLEYDEDGRVMVTQSTIPEPATSALSLLALAAMSARRRRK